jgi:hypothetical protein
MERKNDYLRPGPPRHRHHLVTRWCGQWESLKFDSRVVSRTELTLGELINGES